jgi:hypothetical protein
MKSYKDLPREMVLNAHATQIKIKPRKSQEPFLTFKGPNSLNDLNSFCNIQLNIN